VEKKRCVLNVGGGTVRSNNWWNPRNIGGFKKGCGRLSETCREKRGGL